MVYCPFKKLYLHCKYCNNRQCLPFSLVLQLTDIIRTCVQIRLKWWTVPLRNYIYTVSTVIIGSVCPFLLFSSWLIVFTGSGATQKLLFIIFYYVLLGEGGEIKNIIDLFPQLLGNKDMKTPSCLCNFERKKILFILIIQYSMFMTKLLNNLFLQWFHPWIYRIYLYSPFKRFNLWFHPIQILSYNFLKNPAFLPVRIR